MIGRILLAIITFVGCTFFEVSAQAPMSDIDTLWSDSVLTCSSVDNFFEIMNTPDYIDSNHKYVVRFPMKDGIWFDTTLYPFISHLKVILKEGKILTALPYSVVKLTE